MFTKDLKSQLTPAQLNATSPRTSTFNSTSVDTQNYEGDLLITEDVQTVTGTTPTLDGKVQDSADNSAFADVAGYTFAQRTATGAPATLRVDKRKVRRYVRYVGTIAGTTPSFALSVVAHGQLKTQ